MSERASEPAADSTGSPQDGFWNMYLNATSEEDKFLPGNWEANTGSVLTFTGLFAATVAAFLIESYKSLSPDSGDQTTFLLQQLLIATANMSENVAVNVVPREPFQTPPTSIIVNSLWFSSLVISLVCALLATLIQEWARNYRRNIGRLQKVDGSPRDRAFNHIRVRLGIDRYGMDRTVYLVVALVHLSVLLFVVGLAIFLFPINIIVFRIVAGLLGTLLAAYVIASAIPLFDADCPYQTPATYVLFAYLWCLLHTSNGAFALYSVYFPSTLLLFSVRRYLLGRWMPVAKLREIFTQLITSYDTFLTSRRFAFAWTYASRSMTGNGRQFGEFLESANIVMRENGLQEAGLLDHMWSDRLFLHKIHAYLGRFANSMFSGNIDLSALKTVEMLSSSMFIFGDSLQRTSLFSSGMFGCPMAFTRARTLLKRDLRAAEVFFDILYTLVNIAHNSQNAKNRLVAQLCLAAVRHHLSLACHSAHERGLQAPRDPYATYRRLTPLAVGPEASASIDYGAFIRSLFHPTVALFIMDYRSTWRSSGRVLPQAESRTEPLYVPLHSEACCRSYKSMLSRDGWKHNTASNALTVVSALLEAEPAIRNEVDVPGWIAEFESFDELREHPPSSNLVDALRIAGLGNWMRSGILPNTQISLANPHHEYLSGRGAVLVAVLRKLAMCADWEQYVRVHQPPPWVYIRHDDVDPVSRILGNVGYPVYMLRPAALRLSDGASWLTQRLAATSRRLAATLSGQAATTQAAQEHEVEAGHGTEGSGAATVEMHPLGDAGQASGSAYGG